MATATYTQIYYHVVFSTKNRQPSLRSGRRCDPFACILAIIKNNKSRIHAFGLGQANGDGARPEPGGTLQDGVVSRRVCETSR